MRPPLYPGSTCPSVHVSRSASYKLKLTLPLRKRITCALSPSAENDNPPSKIANMTTAPESEHVGIAPVSSLLVKRLSDKATLPKRGSALAAGYDLYRCVHTPNADSEASAEDWIGSSRAAVLSRKSYPQRARRSSIRKSQSPSPSAHTDALHPGVV